jgi:hypothetical protein
MSRIEITSSFAQRHGVSCSFGSTTSRFRSMQPAAAFSQTARRDEFSKRLDIVPECSAAKKESKLMKGLDNPRMRHVQQAKALIRIRM